MKNIYFWILSAAAMDTIWLLCDWGGKRYWHLFVWMIKRNMTTFEEHSSVSTLLLDHDFLRVKQIKSFFFFLMFFFFFLMRNSLFLSK